MPPPSWAFYGFLTWILSCLFILSQIFMECPSSTTHWSDIFSGTILCNRPHNLARQILMSYVTEEEIRLREAKCLAQVTHWISDEVKTWTGFGLIAELMLFPFFSTDGPDAGPTAQCFPSGLHLSHWACLGSARCGPGSSEHHSASHVEPTVPPGTLGPELAMDITAPSAWLPARPTRHSWYPHPCRPPSAQAQDDNSNSHPFFLLLHSPFYASVSSPIKWV